MNMVKFLNVTLLRNSMEKERELKKIKVFDNLLWTSLISAIIFIFSASFIFSDFIISSIALIFGSLSMIAFFISILIFYFGILFFMLKNKDYSLFFFSIIIPIIALLSYFTILRKKFKQGDFK